MITKNALKIGFAASSTPVAQAAFAALTTRYNNVALEEADIIVALGGDGFMLGVGTSTAYKFGLCRPYNHNPPLPLSNAITIYNICILLI